MLKYQGFDKLVCIKKKKVVSEPANASKGKAFYAYESCFEWYVLLVHRFMIISIFGNVGMTVLILNVLLSCLYFFD
jgi:hypothetical protein